MSADEYVPSDDDVRIEYVLAHQGLEAQLDAGEVYDRWLAAHDARVHRDAAREALGALAEHSDSRDGDGVKGRLGGIIRIWRDAHYPEETP